MNWRGACLKVGVPYSRLAALAALSLAVLAPGCKTTHQTRALTSPGGKLFAVTTDSTPFFQHGPQAGRDPEKRLPKDTLVKLIRPSFGYSKIELVSSGEKGYILSDNIKPASPSLIAAATTVTEETTVAHTFGSPRETFDFNSNDPRLVPPPEQLPPPDLPPQTSPPEQ